VAPLLACLRRPGGPLPHVKTKSIGQKLSEKKHFENGQTDRHDLPRTNYQPAILPVPSCKLGTQLHPPPALQHGLWPCAGSTVGTHAFHAKHSPESETVTTPLVFFATWNHTVSPAIPNTVYSTVKGFNSWQLFENRASSVVFDNESLREYSCFLTKLPQKKTDYIQWNWKENAYELYCMIPLA